MRWIMLAGAMLALQGTFEGTVTYQFTSKNGKSTTFDYVAKGHKVLLQPHDSTPGMFGAMIVDNDAKTRTIVVPSRKMYMTSPINDNASLHFDSSAKNVKLVKTGSETVSGVSCDDYTTTGATGNDSGTVCIAHGMGNWEAMGLGASPLAQMEQHIQGLSAAASGGFFPLKWTGKDGQSMVAVKIDQKHVDPSVFTPPADYTTMQMPPGAMSRMQGANKP